MTPLDQANALLKAAEEATPGPWSAKVEPQRYPESDDADYPCYVRQADGLEVAAIFEPYSNMPYEANAAFIALARNTAPAIASALLEKQKALEECRAVLAEAKRVIEKSARDTLWVEDGSAETMCDKIDALLARQGEKV